MSSSFYTNPKKVLSFPLTFGNSWTVPFHDSSAYTSGQYTVVSNGSTTYTVDARGTVKTNVGTYSNAYRVKVVTTGTAVTTTTFSNGQTQTYSDALDSNPVYYWYAADNHAYILTVANNSAGVGSIYYTRTFLASPVTGVGNIAALANQLTIYPNPSNDIVNIKANNLKIIDVTLFNVAGQQLSNINWVRISDQNGFLKIEKLPKGMYLARVNTVNGVVNKKFSVLY